MSYARTGRAVGAVLTTCVAFTAAPPVASGAPAPLLTPEPARLGAVLGDRFRLAPGGDPISLPELRARRPAPSTWLLRIQAEWCGTCQWHAGWTPELARRYRGRVLIVDVVVADRDNEPASLAAGRAWRRRTGGEGLTLIGEVGSLDAWFPNPAPLPRILIVNPRSWSVLGTFANPGPERLMDALDRALDGSGEPPAAPPAPAASLVDGRWSADQWALILGMRLPGGPPADPTNRVADDPAAAALGRQLFFDRSLSPAGRACSSCHDPELLFTNGKDVAAEGVGPGQRNVPSVVFAGHARTFLWDGRADALWSQAVLPFEDRNELGSSRLFVAHAVRTRHRSAYEAVFGWLPALGERDRFPLAGRPGEPAWQPMAAADQEAITRVLVNVGKSIAAFERSLVVAPNTLDRYAAGDHDALSTEAKEGLGAFLAAGCAQCHWGPRLSDDAFHNLRFPTGRADGQADRGRLDGAALQRSSEFTTHGRFSDARQRRRPPVAGEQALGAFKTPGLRGVPFTMPYGHGGGFGGLTSVVEAHRTGGLPPGSRYAVGRAEPWAQGFDPARTPMIVRFLELLRADLAPPREPLVADR